MECGSNLQNIYPSCVGIYFLVVANFTRSSPILSKLNYNFVSCIAGEGMGKPTRMSQAMVGYVCKRFGNIGTGSSLPLYLGLLN